MRVLLITTQFPPESNGGVNRPYSLYKYLPAYGIDVTVVTKKLGNNTQDEAGIIRTDSFINWREYPFFSFKRISRYLSFLGYKYFHVYTDKWWVRKSISETDRLVTKGKFDLVYATFPAVESIKTALGIKKKLGIPLIVEFRDGLVYEPCLPAPPKLLQRMSMKALEEEAVQEAAAVITIGNDISNYFKRTYKKEIFTVFNGYDADDFKDLPEPLPANSGKTRIVHFGNLSVSRPADRSGIFYAIQRLKREGHINSSNFEVCFIGNVSEQEKEVGLRLDISELISFLPTMNKRAGFLKIREEFNYLLFYGVEGQSTVISSKLPEYIRLHMPILGICKGNEAEHIIRDTHTGEVCDFDADAIYELLLKAVKGKVAFNPDEKTIAGFDRKVQAGQIAAIIRNAIA